MVRRRAIVGDGVGFGQHEGRGSRKVRVRAGRAVDQVVELAGVADQVVELQGLAAGVVDDLEAVGRDQPALQLASAT